MPHTRTVLADIVLAYGQFRERYEQALHRGDYDRADDAMSVMQDIERCVSINETSTAWRKTVADIKNREQRR